MHASHCMKSSSSAFWSSILSWHWPVTIKYNHNTKSGGSIWLLITILVLWLEVNEWLVNNLPFCMSCPTLKHRYHPYNQRAMFFLSLDLMSVASPLWQSKHLLMLGIYRQLSCKRQLFLYVLKVYCIYLLSLGIFY